jgi:DNA-binding transcriptional LysR family regulator
MRTGRIDYFLYKPCEPVVTRLYPVVDDLLGGLRRTKQERGFESIRIIGEQWNPRSHALRDILERSTVPFGFYDSESEEGRRILAQAGVDGSGINITPAHAADHVTMGMSLIASTGGVGLLPAYAQNFLPSSVTSRPLKGDAPTVELVLGYKKSNESPILKLLLSRLDELVARVSKKTAKTRNALSKRDYAVLESGEILILSAIDWMSTNKRASSDG